MNNLTPKGRYILIVVGVIVVLIIGWLIVRGTQRASTDEQGNEFTDTPATEAAKLPDLPHETDHYRVEFDYSNNQLVIAPRVQINGDANPQEEYARVWSTYEQYAQEAITWLKGENVDLHAFDVYFVGEDFWPDGKQISL